MPDTESSMKHNATEQTVQSQIDRLTKSKKCFRKRDIEIQISYGNSCVGQEVEALRRMIGDQWSIIDDFKVSGFVSEFNAILDENRRNAKLGRLHRERLTLIDELEELNSALLVAQQKLDEFSQKRKSAKMERAVLEHLIKFTYDDSTQNNNRKNGS